MPKMYVTTTKAEKIWSTPDGSKSIFSVNLDYQGKPFQAKTYSGAIAKEGWSGEVETYEKQGSRGAETFIKQPQKEGFFGGDRPKYQPKDDSAIKAMWAIGKAVEAHIGSTSLPENDFESVEMYASELFAMVDRIKQPKTEADPTLATPVVETDRENPGPVDLAEINRVFGSDNDTLTEGDLPWNKTEELPALPL